MLVIFGPLYLVRDDGYLLYFPIRGIRPFLRCQGKSRGTAEKGLAARDPCSRVARLLRGIERGALTAIVESLPCRPAELPLRAVRPGQRGNGSPECDDRTKVPFWVLASVEPTATGRELEKGTKPSPKAAAGWPVW